MLLLKQNNIRKRSGLGQDVVPVHKLQVNEQGHEKMSIMPYANSKGADQPAHPNKQIKVTLCNCQSRTFKRRSRIAILVMVC